ncbi:MAG: mechanosensitive ion channel domain-containing protein [Thermodesulfobacteriota bacterium]
MDEGLIDRVENLAGRLDVWTVLLLFAGILFLVAAVRLLRRLATGLHRRLPTRRILVSQVATVLEFVIYIFGSAFLFLAVIQPSREILFAAAGSAAVALGFASKDLVSSLIAGLILLFDRPFQVGDRVTFGNVYGEIRNIGLRAVRLVTLDDNLVTIPNHRFLADVVSSGNAGNLDMMVTMDFHVALDSDLAAARDILHETLVTSRYIFLKKPVEVVASEAAVSGRLAMRLQAKAYVMDVRFEKAFQTDIYIRGTEALRRGGIKRPPLELAVTA